MSFWRGFGIGVIATLILEFFIKNVPILRANFWESPRTYFGYHFHHSLYGIAFLLAGAYYLSKNKKKKAIFLTGIGIGVIVVHTFTESRLTFLN